MADMKFKSFESLFKSSENQNKTASKEHDVTLLEVEKLVDFRNHPFKPYSQNKLVEMADSIKQLGILNPIIARKIENGRYEIIAGHNRTAAAMLAGLTHVPVNVLLDIDDDTATLMMIGTNLYQRENISPSEKGRAYRLQVESLNRQGKRIDLTSSQNGKKINSLQQVAEENETSKNQIHRFIRLTYLIPKLLDLVDQDKLNFTFAVELSYLKENEQILVHNLIQEKVYCLTASNVAKLKENSKLGKLSDELIMELLQSHIIEAKINVFKNVEKTIKQYGIPSEQIENVINRALELFCQTEEYKDLLI